MPQGFIDEVSEYRIRGWAVADDCSQPARVLIDIDGLATAFVRCGGYRADLHEAGIREGFAEFNYAFPEEVRDGKEHKILVKHEIGGDVLWEGRISFDAMTNSNWCFDAKNDGQHCIVNRQGHLDEIVFQLKSTKKLAILATFRTSRMILDYQKSIARDLRDQGYAVVYVDVPQSNSTPMDYEWADGPIHIIRRLNFGYDFGSWSAGLAEVAEGLEHAEEIILMNDSCFPLAHLSNLLQRMRDKDGDVVGVCDSFEHIHHLQSQLLMFRGGSVSGSFLPRFFDAYNPSSDKDYTVTHGELGITEKARQEGLKISTVVSYEDISNLWLENVPAYVDHARSILPAKTSKTLEEKFEAIAESIALGQPLNPSHFFWDLLICGFHCPLVKKEFLLFNPCFVPSSFMLSDILSRFQPSRINAIEEARSYVPGARAHALHSSQKTKRWHPRRTLGDRASARSEDSCLTTSRGMRSSLGLPSSLRRVISKIHPHQSFLDANE